MTAAYESGLGSNAANYVPLSPISFLFRTAEVFPDRLAVAHGRRRYTWTQTKERCCRLASALTKRGIGKGDTVAAFLPNIPEMFEAHQGVPMTGAVLNAINYRLDAASVAFILKHGEAKVLITDSEYAPLMRDALAQVSQPILVIDVEDSEGPGGERLGSLDYESFLSEGESHFDWQPPVDEWDAISLNYTSGTTGDPKGVVYHHRGAYLNAVGNALTWSLPQFPVYLWTLPMFHCNGWCFPWTITAKAGTHVCLRRVEAGLIYKALAEEGVTHLCGAPIVMQMLVNVGPDESREFDQKVKFMTAAAPPPASVLARMAQIGVEVTHVYGLTEVYGPAVVCEWDPRWDDLPLDQQAALKSRQGVTYPVQEALMVADPQTLEPVPRDGETIGEVFLRGNITMKGYLKNAEATEEAFAGGWFHSGDLGVMHPDGYIELKDRSKDIIISGGENISSIEVENVLYRHVAVAAVAVVAKPDEKWGETPCAFVELVPGAEVDAEELIAFCRERMARFKAPRNVVFGPLPKTSTGKIQKFELRLRLRSES
ncbi:acyl-CoA synthetase [Limibacillus halophilus]|uniref:3-methylmercaptopropionyl-CoA ligase n=1 Tax=Limibacillus halophilus TaxID=1579333 RepID=A0A839SYT5_9PROT|nr:acyl-CoA synthetase [Limibacillus halophilus]MBB3066840.1 fatty-acyl-CoA synthase [Limibacillus halophilus]